MNSEGYVSIQFKTNIYDIYFDDESDSDRFDDWLRDLLAEHNVFDYNLDLTPTDIQGVSKLSVSVDDFDYTHLFDIRVSVDDYTHTYDELYDNQALIDYVEKVVAPQVLSDLNALLTGISFPMTKGGTQFRDMKFEYGEFYCMLGYSEKYGYFPSFDPKNVQFVIEDDFEVYV